MEAIWCARDLPKKLVRMTSAGAGEKSVQDTHIHGGAYTKNRSTTVEANERTHAHAFSPLGVVGCGKSENMPR